MQYQCCFAIHDSRMNPAPSPPAGREAVRIMRDACEVKEALAALETRLSALGTETGVPYSKDAPYQGDDYMCADCYEGCVIDGLLQPFYTSDMYYSCGGNKAQQEAWRKALTPYSLSDGG